MLPLLVVLLSASVSAQRQFCPGASCTSSAQCTQPNGLFSTVNGFCCGGSCVATPPVMQKGSSCNNADPCMQCGPGLACTNGVCVQPPITRFTPGCKCSNGSQCLSGNCGSPDGVCLGTQLYAGSSCKYGAQCISGWCDKGSCRGIDTADVSTVNVCGSNNDCTLGQICGPWGESKSGLNSQCHGLSTDKCYSNADCKDIYGHLYPQVECVGGSATAHIVGQCMSYPKENQICGQAYSAPSQCAYYSDSSNGVSFMNQYVCNTSIQPSTCQKPVNYAIAVGQNCQVSNVATVPSCVLGAYCDTNQPLTGFQTINGVCRNDNTLALGVNCSDTTLACQNPSTTICKANTSTGVYICQTAINSFGQPCNYSNATSDFTQCPSDFGLLSCACNSTCAYPQNNGVSSGQCGSGTFVNYYTLLNSFPSTPNYAMAKYGGNKHYLADYICCNSCGGSAETVLASSTGVIIDCQSFSITDVKICDDTYNNSAYYLQNCAKYVGAQGGASIAHVSIPTLIILSIATFLTIF